MRDDDLSTRWVARFIGYVPQLSTAVWVGRPEDGVPMTDVHGIAVTGGSYPARIFSRYMRAPLAGVPAQDLYTALPDELLLRPAPKKGPDRPRRPRRFRQSRPRSRRPPPEAIRP